MEFSSNKISDFVNQIQEINLALKRKYMTEWNDDVHSSFEKYIDLCNKNISKLIEINESIYDLCKNLNELKIDEKIKNAKTLVNESKSLYNKANSLVKRNI